uniref:Uncharacterized protein n=1 Tax=Salix viminalis TaxID=40686 RepID=A0A6N2KUI7_SALVM
MHKNKNTVIYKYANIDVKKRGKKYKQKRKTPSRDANSCLGFTWLPLCLSISLTQQQAHFPASWCLSINHLQIQRKFQAG